MLLALMLTFGIEFEIFRGDSYSDTSPTTPSVYSSCKADDFGVGGSFDQYEEVNISPTFDTTKELNSSFVSRLSRLFLHMPRLPMLIAWTTI